LVLIVFMVARGLSDAQLKVAAFVSAGAAMLKA
jgi:hypothetical protein